MIDLDFSKIRIYDGSQQNGFEELICQLAHLSPPDNADYFVRKEGAGGDAGVECYWKLKDDSEHAWQAKYFIESINDNQWIQISESVKTALDKHPKITKYYVCLPRDWTDSRKKTKSRKTVESAWDKWEKHVLKWQKIVEEKGIKVDFIYWCKHEISQMLQVDNPYFSGRALYWFNEPVIHNDLLKKVAKKSQDSLGDRFTPEFHVNLPIAKQFDGLGLTPAWKHRLEEQSKIFSKLTDMFSNKDTKLLSNQINWVNLRDSFSSLNHQFVIYLKKDSFLDNVKSLHELCLKILEQTNKCRSYLLEQRESLYKKNQKDMFRDLFSTLSNFNNELSEFENFLTGNSVASALSKAAIVLGEAGIGKSHLLCDIALKRLEASLPTVFLLGQHYDGGNPLDLILDKLDLKGNSCHQVLAALDAAGEAKRTRTLIVIDAINEGSCRNQWHNYIRAFLSEISNYPNLSILLSCRSTYVDYILPDELSKNSLTLTHLNHDGFRGYEHRAASQYLSKQGISKPSTPVMSPEFSNPLFLKNCCKALKNNGYTSFPKGLNGINQLFDFYIDSVQKNINRKKKYLPRENVVRNAIDEFVKSLYPENLSGISISDARKIIDSLDYNSQIGKKSLTNILIDEGILAFDVIPEIERKSRGKEVIRFTYERFSDHFIAQHILEKHVKDGNIAALFYKEQFIGKMLNEGKLYEFAGIIEALGICIPEKFGCEFIDFIPKNSNYYEWLFQRTFTDVVLWRSPDSFTENTIKLLNQITYDDYNKEAIDIVLSLSTEPSHPWNANFLHKKLFRMTLPERDAFWSTYIAISDSEEDEEQPESIIRTLIEWSLSADFAEIEPERLRLTAITLTWLTTTSNRKVRDQATKSLARIMSKIPNLIPSLIEQFNDTNDPYLVERFYAAIYGTICNIDCKNSIRKVAESVFKNVFQQGNPYPNILLRDYARRIMELAYDKGLLASSINPDTFRPPYKSNWPIENYSEQEIEALMDATFSIRHSLFGGDFGIYTMSCIHNWSPTLLSEPKPETGYEIQKNFANLLSDDLKTSYLSYLDTKIRTYNNKSDINIEDIFEKIGNDILNEEVEDFEVNNKEVEPWDKLKEKIEASLTDEQKETFRWINGLGISDKPAAFSRKLAKRWICKRVYELGWSSELFEHFENNLRYIGRMRPHIERIGKKYQWIAFYELLARMADNVYWIDYRYNDTDSNFDGPWQISKRDIDPTFWQRKTENIGREDSCWWQPYIFLFANDELEKQQSWLWNRKIIPPFRELLKITAPSDNRQWLVLQGFSDWRKEFEESEIPSQNGWFRINSCIVRKQDVQKLKQQINGKNLCDPSILSLNNNIHQGFLKEYPWHPIYKGFMDWIVPSDESSQLINIKHLVPVSQYDWESGDTDDSINETISLYLPAKLLIKELGIISQSEPGLWIDSNGNEAFIDPSAKNGGPSYALIKYDILQPWLEKNELQLVWLVGGEKQLFDYMENKFYGRLVYSGMFIMNNGDIDGDIWFIEDKPD